MGDKMTKEGTLRAQLEALVLKIQSTPCMDYSEIVEGIRACMPAADAYNLERRLEEVESFVKLIKRKGIS
jgi:hypothetical protein